MKLFEFWRTKSISKSTGWYRNFWRENSNIWKISNTNLTNSTKNEAILENIFGTKIEILIVCKLLIETVEERQTWHWSPLTLYILCVVFCPLQERRWNQETYETHRASFDNFDGSRVSNQSQFVPTVFYQPGIWIQPRSQRKVISITFNSQLAISCLIWHNPDNTPLSYFLC